MNFLFLCKASIGLLMLTFVSAGHSASAPATKCPHLLLSEESEALNDDYKAILDGSPRDLNLKRRKVRDLLARALKPFLFELVRQIRDNHQRYESDIDVFESDEDEVIDSEFIDTPHPLRVQIYWSQMSGEVDFGVNEQNLETMLAVARIFQSIQKDLNYEQLAAAMNDLEVVRAHTFAKGDAKIAFEEATITLLFATSFLTAHRQEALGMSSEQVLRKIWLPQENATNSLMDILSIWAPSGTVAQFFDEAYSSEPPLQVKRGGERVFFTPPLIEALRRHYSRWHENRSQADESIVGKSFVELFDLSPEQALISEEFGHGCPMSLCLEEVGESGLSMLLREVLYQLDKFELL